MKIAFLSQYFHPETFSNNAIAEALVARGHEVHAVPCVPNYPAGTFFPGYSNRARREETWRGVAIHRARTWPRGRSAASLALNYLVYPVTATWTAMRRVPGRPDVSFVSMPSPLLQAFAGVFLAAALPAGADADPPGDPVAAYIDRWVAFYPSRAYARGHAASAARFEQVTPDAVAQWLAFNRATVTSARERLARTGLAAERRTDLAVLARAAEDELANWAERSQPCRPVP